MFTHYEDMKCDEKCKNWGSLGVRGHPRSLAIDRIWLPIQLWKTLCVYIVLFSSYSAFFVKSDEFQPTPPAFVAVNFGVRKL